jgi:CRP-like cAMP-binding protein
VLPLVQLAHVGQDRSVQQQTSVEELSQSSLLGALPAERLQELAVRMTRQELAPGDAPVVEREEGDRFYIVLEGVMAVSTVGATDRLRYLRHGDHFGEIALSLDIPRTATVRALTATTVASCDRPTFDEYVRPLLSAER